MHSSTRELRSIRSINCSNYTELFQYMNNQIMKSEDNEMNYVGRRSYVLREKQGVVSDIKELEFS